MENREGMIPKNRSIKYLLSVEIGGLNGLTPLICAAKRTDLKVIDGGFRGRAFPCLHMVSPAFVGKMITPLIAKDEYGQTFLLDNALSNEFAEKMARHACEAFGMKC